MKRRSIEQRILSLKGKDFGWLMVFTGARQVGKTTLVRHLLNDYHYITFDDVVAAKSYATLTASQWHDAFPCAVLDEVQKEPQIVDSIKAVYDLYSDANYALLGSSQIVLLDKVRESLAGRCRIIEMFPLTLPELRTDGWDNELPLSCWQRLLTGETAHFFPDFTIHPEMSPISQAWGHYLRFGGYPALTNENLTDEDRYIWLADYIRTYLERDVRDLARLRDLEPYMKLQRWMASQSGQLVMVEHTARDVGVSSKTIKQYINYLQLSYQVLLLPAWSRNPFKRLAKAPKVHFLDFGVLQGILNKRGGMTGSEFESAVVSELYKQTRNVASPADFYHLRTSDGFEVDLLVETPDGYYAFEIKQTEHVTPTDARHLKKLTDILDKPLLHAFILSNDPKTLKISDNITALSAPLFLG